MKRAMFGMLLAAAVAMPAHAQTFPVDDPVLKRMWALGMDSSRAMDLAQVLTDSIGPRLTGTPNYQSSVDWLVRTYGFAPNEVVYGDDGNLPLAVDPKVAWALAHPECFPVDVSSASYERLVRVPGVGPRSARRIVDERRRTAIRGLSDLRQFGVVANRAGGFLTLRGRRLQPVRWTQQLALWRPEDEVGARHETYDFSPGTFR